MSGARPLYKQEILRMLKYLRDSSDWRSLRNEVYILVASYLGLRVSEAIALTWRDFTGGYLKIGRRKGQNSERLMLPVVVEGKLKDLRSLYKRQGFYVGLDGYILKGRGNLPLDRRSVDRIVKEIAVKVEVFEQVSTHSFRKFFALTAYEKTLGKKDIVKMKSFGGWKSLDSVAYYLNSMPDEELRASLYDDIGL